MPEPDLPIVERYGGQRPAGQTGQDATAETRDVSALLTVLDLAKSYGPRTLWTGLNFSVARGQLCALTGPSGAGKTTLLNCLGLLESVDRGRILVDGADTTRFGRRAARRFRRDVLGYLFQNYALIENATVRDNLDVATPGRRRSGRSKQHDALEHVGLAGRSDELVYRLSGGEQQRVALARLLVKRPSVVLADEPTGALDDDNAAMVLDTLRSMANDGCAVVIATHSREIQDTCDAVRTL